MKSMKHESDTRVYCSLCHIRFKDRASVYRHIIMKHTSVTANWESQLIHEYFCSSIVTFRCSSFLTFPFSVLIGNYSLSRYFWPIVNLLMVMKHWKL
jgi:hypothetical protein